MERCRSGRPQAKPADCSISSTTHMEHRLCRSTTSRRNYLVKERCRSGRPQAKPADCSISSTTHMEHRLCRSTTLRRDRLVMERCRSGRTGRSRKPLSSMSSEGSNPSLSATGLSQKRREPCGLEFSLCVSAIFVCAQLPHQPCACGSGARDKTIFRKSR